MPKVAAGYKRTYKHSGNSRGSETRVRCSFCGKTVPRYKTFPVYSGFRINDAGLRKEIDRRDMHFMSQKKLACPGCARHRGIVRKGRSRKSER